MKTPTSLKQNLIEGLFGVALNSKFSYQLGRKTATYLNARKLIVGGDNHRSSPLIQGALSDGICSTGCDVIDIGAVGTEELRFAIAKANAQGGLMVTSANKNTDINGIALYDKSGQQFTQYNALLEVVNNDHDSDISQSKVSGSIRHISYSPRYIQYLLNLVDLSICKPLRVIVNPNHGTAGYLINELEVCLVRSRVPVEIIKLNNQPDSDFPFGIPDLNDLSQQRKIQTAITSYHADMGVAWNVDFSQCSVFDEKARLVPLSCLDSIMLQHKELTNLMSEQSAMLPWLILMEKISRNQCSLSSLQTAY